MSQLLNIAAVHRHATAGGINLFFPDEIFAEIALGLYDPDLTTLQSDLAGTRSRGWNEQLNEPGSASFIIQHDNPDIALVTQKKLVNFAYRGHMAFTMIVEALDRAHIDQSEEAGQFTTVTGRGHLALLEKALVYPTLGPNNLPVETDRHINWTNPFYDDSGWIQATEVTDVATAQAAGWAGLNWNTDFPDGGAFIIWASDGTTTSAGVGHCYTRLVINTGISVPAKAFLTGDNSAQLYIDGQIICAVDFNDLATSNFPLSAGLHMVAAHGENLSGLGSNPAGIAWAIYGTDVEGNLTGLIADSSDACKIVEYAPNPPGVTVGFAMGQIIDQLQARGILTGLTRTFTDTSDSYGEPWPVIADIGTRVGVDVLSFFVELAQTYMDFWMTPGLFELNAVNAGQRGTV